jgi:hypothetical protein
MNTNKQPTKAVWKTYGEFPNTSYPPTIPKTRPVIDMKSKMLKDSVSLSFLLKFNAIHFTPYPPYLLKSIIDL